MRRLVVVVLAFALLAAGCADSATPARDEQGRAKLTLVLDWTPNTNHSGIYIAKQKGWYDDAGIDLSIVQPGEGASGLQMLATGKADFAISTEEEVTPAVAQGIPVKSVAAILQHNTSSLVALRSSGITRPRDLEGKTYGGFGGQLEKALVETLVRCDGGDPSQVDFTNVGNADYRVGLTKGHYDFVWIFDGWDGLRFKRIDKLDTVSIPFIDYTKCIPDWYTPVIATSTKLLDADPDTARAFMQATKRGYEEAAAHPDAAVDALTSAVPDLDTQLVRMSAAYLATRYAEDMADWGRQDPAVWKRMTGFLDDAGMLDDDVQVDDLYTNDLLDQ